MGQWRDEKVFIEGVSEWRGDFRGGIKRVCQSGEVISEGGYPKGIKRVCIYLLETIQCHGSKHRFKFRLLHTKCWCQFKEYVAVCR